MLKKKTAKKKYTPNSKEKYMCAKHKKFFTDELLKWKRDIIKANNLEIDYKFYISNQIMNPVKQVLDLDMDVEKTTKFFEPFIM